jgi:hypothetical protein
VLVLDADEMLSAELKSQILKAVEDDTAGKVELGGIGLTLGAGVQVDVQRGPPSVAYFAVGGGVQMTASLIVGYLCHLIPLPESWRGQFPHFAVTSISIFRAP